MPKKREVQTWALGQHPPFTQLSPAQHWEVSAQLPPEPLQHVPLLHSVLTLPRGQHWLSNVQLTPGAWQHTPLGLQLSPVQHWEGSPQASPAVLQQTSLVHSVPTKPTGQHCSPLVHELPGPGAWQHTCELESQLSPVQHCASDVHALPLSVQGVGVGVAVGVVGQSASMFPAMIASDAMLGSRARKLAGTDGSSRRWRAT